MSAAGTARSFVVASGLRARASVSRRTAAAASSVDLDTARTCRRCKQQYVERHNHSKACRFHPELFTGGEVSKYVGFLRKSADPADQLSQVLGTGIRRFYDCCGADHEEAPGCTLGKHVPFD